MNRGFAVFIILALISVILSFVIPDNSKRGFTNALSSYMIADEENKLNYDDTREHLRVPAELPFEYDFDNKEFNNGFEYEFNPNIHSGYYHKPQTLKFDCSDTIWYTTDGTLPEKNKTAYLYDNEKVIRLDTGVTNICIRAEKDGKMSRVYVGSYVILGSTEDAFYGYGYNSLDKYDRYIYRSLYKAMSNYETKFDVPFTNVSYQRLYRIFMCVNYDNPLLIQAPLSFVSWSGNKKDAKYDYTLESDGAYEAFGVLTAGSGVCESYSRAYQYLCQCIGVDNLLIVGTSNDEPHMWNMVMLGGEWYHADLTWDDRDNGGIEYYYFAFNDKNLKEYGERTISPELNESRPILEMYSDSNYYPIPAARGTEYSVSNILLY